MQAYTKISKKTFVAVYAPPDDLYGMGRMFQVYAMPYYNSRIRPRFRADIETQRNRYLFNPVYEGNVGTNGCLWVYAKTTDKN